MPPVVALTMLLVANCGGGGNQSNPDPVDVVVDVDSQFVDVGQRYFLDATDSTDPNGDFEDIEFIWRITNVGDDVSFEDHCRNDFDEICDENDDDHCSNDETRFCEEDEDCTGFGTCTLNSGTTSPDCTTGICGLGEGDEGDQATFVASVAGPFSVRVTAVGTESNGTKTRILDTYPSLFVVGSIVEFGGTGGDLVGEVADSAEFAPGAFQGASDPANGNLVVIDETLHFLRVFDLRTGEILGPFGDSDRFVNLPVAITFNPDNNRLFVAEAGGQVLMFDDESGFLISAFGNVGAGPVALEFSPVTGNLLVVYGDAGSGVREFDKDDGSDLGVLGQTAAAAGEPVDIDFLGEDENFDLLIADRTGKVVRCNPNGTGCGSFSSEADDMLAPGSPSAIAVNPSSDFTDNDVMIADPAGERVIACNSNGGSCGTFGDTDEIDSEYRDVFFSPATEPTTTTSTSTTTSTTLE